MSAILGNAKRRGELGVRVVIGELAKLGIDVALPLSDNLPVDLICFLDDRLLRAQVKTSLTLRDGCVSWSLRTTNWHRGTHRKYAAGEIDVVLLCDMAHVYVIGPRDFVNRRSFTIRIGPARNRQTRGIHDADAFRLSIERLRAVVADRAAPSMMGR